MVKYVLKSGGEYVKSTRYQRHDSLEKVQAEVQGLPVLEEQLKEMNKALLEDQIFTTRQADALQFDTLDELNNFFNRNMDDFLKEEYEYHVEIIYVKS